MPPRLKNTDALAIRRLQQKMCKERRYNKMKNDPEILEIEKIKRRQRYLKQKEAKKERSLHDQREQRKKWRENSKRYRQRKKEVAVEEKATPFETIHIQPLAELDHTEVEEPDIKIYNPLPYCPRIQAEVMKVQYDELRRRKKLLRIIATLKEREKSQLKHIQKLKHELIQLRASHSPHEQLDSDDVSESEEKESPIIENVIKLYSEDTNRVVHNGKKQIITNNEDRKQKRASKTKKQQRGWVFVGVKNKPVKKHTANVKEEPEWETDRNASQQVTQELTGYTAVVKEEPEWETDRNVSQQVTQELTDDTDISDAHLQMDIEIKQEIEVGPVQLQPQDIYYSYRNNKEKLKKL